jgi:hypothetical protein
MRKTLILMVRSLRFEGEKNEMCKHRSSYSSNSVGTPFIRRSYAKRRKSNRFWTGQYEYWSESHIRCYELNAQKTSTSRGNVRLNYRTMTPLQFNNPYMGHKCLCHLFCRSIMAVLVSCLHCITMVAILNRSSRKQI